MLIYVNVPEPSVNMEVLSDSKDGDATGTFKPAKKDHWALLCQAELKNLKQDLNLSNVCSDVGFMAF